MAVAISQAADLAGVVVANNVGVYSGAGIGAAAADRIVVLAVSSALNNSGATRATIDGVAMWPGTQGNQGSLFSRLFWLPWPIGTTAEFRVTFSSTNPSAVQNHAAVYRVVGAALPTGENVVNDSDADPISTTGQTITVVAGGGALALDAHANPATARTWTGVTEDLDETSGASGFRFGTGFLNSAGGTSLTITVSGANSEDATLAWVLFAPGTPPLLDISEIFVGAGAANISGPALVMRSNALFAGTGNYFGDGSISQGAPPLVGTAAYIGVGNLLAASAHFTAGKYDETGEIGALSISPDAFTELEFGLKIDLDNNAKTGDILRFRVYANGVALDVYSITPSITIAAHAIAATAAFAGIGNVAASAKMILRPTALFAGLGTANFSGPTLRVLISEIMQGAGNLSATPALLMRGFATFAGTGAKIFSGSIFKFASFAYLATGNQSTTAKLLMQASAPFAGAGAMASDTKLFKFANLAYSASGLLIPGTTHFSAGKYDETGEASSTIAADAFTELEFGLKLDFDNTNTGDTLSFRVYANNNPLDQYVITPTITVAAHAIRATALFIGLGNLVAEGTIVGIGGQLLEGTAAFSGVGNLVATAFMLLRPTAAFAGVGSLSAIEPRLRLQSQATFAGVGAFAITPQLRMSASALFAGTSIFLISTNKTLLDTAEQFLAVGTLIVTARSILSPTETLQGAGVLTASPVLRMVSSILLNATGLMQAEANIAGAVTQWSGSAAFAGIGTMIATPQLLMAASEILTGVGVLSATPSLQMRALAAYSATGAFAASIGSATISSNAIFAGLGSQTVAPQLIMQATANFAGAGLMSVSASALGQLIGSAAYLGIGNMAVSVRLRMAASEALSGQGVAAFTPVLRMRATTLQTGTGLLSATAAMMLRASATFAGIGTARFSADVLRLISAAFSGVGAMTATPRMRLGPTAAYSGAGSMSVVTRQRMMELLNFVGSGLMAVDLTFKTQQIMQSAIFVGAGNFNSIARLRMRTSAAFSAVGGMSADTIKFINLSEQVFAGTGYFSAQVQQTMAAFAELRGLGNFRLTTFMLHEPLTVTICDLGATFATGTIGLAIATNSLATDIDYGTIDTEIGCH